jgi:hypothetical protein
MTMGNGARGGISHLISRRPISSSRMAFHATPLNMKKLLVRALALLATLVPLQLAVAAPNPPPVFGGWSPGKTFTMRVTDASSYTNQGGGNVAVPVPKGAPVFTLGEEVTFTIGKKGELIAPGVKIAFSVDGGSANVYVGKAKKIGAPPTASVFKSNVTGEPLSVNMDFVIVKIKNRIPTITWVNYKFNP